jgi:hypothetical protein
MASSEKHTAEYFARYSGDEAAKAKALEFAQDWPVAFFQCEVSEECGIHGPFVNKIRITEYSEQSQQFWNKGRYDISCEDCPDCEFDMGDRLNTSHVLDLSLEEHKRPGWYG